MRTLFFILFTFFLIPAFSQSRTLRKLTEKLEKIYDSDYFMSLDFIITPAVYNPHNDSNITHIEFYQDTINVVFESTIITAGIDKREGFTNNYSIGQIFDYMVDKRNLGLFIETTYNNGSKKIVYKKIHFDEILPQGEVFEDAQYSAGELFEYDGYTQL